MSNELASLLLDVVVLILLGTTIYYVVRLTKGLQDFKKHRQEFDSVIANLLASIDQADQSVRSLKTVSAQEAGRLEVSVAQARALCDELKIITEAGESMAKRLEKLAETNRRIAQTASDSQSVQKRPYRSRKSTAQPSHYDRQPQKRISSPVYQDTQSEKIEKDNASTGKITGNYGQTLKRVEKKYDNAEKDLPSFMIKDRDSEEFGSPQNYIESSPAKSQEENHSSQTPRSQAEKELLDALRNTRKSISENK
ncbi:MAG: DUF6468 domain-containing protein [Alphaproteobacteria bacterium]